ncbi:MAG TPA: glycosyl hydrolase family 28-related protein [Jatrophihabitans sp.]|jgi:hypothetical protein|uniref:glycosyl hydrolase family 28-related protein n=1 Tax=Jatrophihabitans sp. TaxID=1932789 RepID=UPI002F10F815
MYAINAKDYGAVGDGLTDDTSALNDAAAAALAVDENATLFIPAGAYRTTGTVTFMCQVDGGQSTLQYHGVGTAVALGSPDGTVARKVFSVPRVINAARTTGWDGSSVGVKAVNLNNCVIDLPLTQDFETGFLASGHNGGFAYNTINVGTLWCNHNQVKLQPEGTGWVNQNLFLGGRMQHAVGVKGAVELDPNARQIWMAAAASGPAGPPNSNTFLNTSIEDNGVCFYLVDDAGFNNTYSKCRWERPVAYPPKVLWRAGSNGASIDGGYDALKVIEVFEGTMITGSVRDGIGGYASATGVVAQSIPTTTSTAVTAWGTPVMRRCDYDPATGLFKPRPGRWLITATITFVANATGRRLARLSAAGNVIDIAEIDGAAGLRTLKLSGSAVFNGSQTFSVSVQQTSGSNLALVTTSPYVRIDANYLPS